MPPRGRKAKSTVRGPSSQSTLSFNSKSARVTKPNSRQDDSVSKKLSDPVQAQIKGEVSALQQEEPDVTEVKATPQEEDEEEVKEEPQKDDVQYAEEEVEAIVSKGRSKSRKKAASAKNERELAAESVTDAQLKKYWKAEEDSRLAPRVHQSDVSLHEKILRHFDLSSQFGPCIGIPRLQRWRRANTLGLNPPVEVLAVLLREEDKTTSQGCGKLAYIDELGSGRVVLVE